MFNPENFPLPELEKEKSELSKEKPELSYGDCLYLSRESIGLRHVSGQDKAKEEKTQGIEYGDAIAAGSFANLISSKEMKEIRDAIKIKEDILPPTDLFDNVLRLLIQKGSIGLPEELKNELTTRFGGVIKNFIESSFIFDLMGAKKSGEDTAGSIIDKIIGSETYFLFGRFNGADRAEAEEGYPIGKCGTQRVPPENIYNSFTIERADFDNLTLNKDLPADGDMEGKIFSHASQALYDKFLNETHKLQENKEK